MISALLAAVRAARRLLTGPTRDQTETTGNGIVSAGPVTITGTNIAGRDQHNNNK